MKKCFAPYAKSGGSLEQAVEVLGQPTECLITTMLLNSMQTPVLEIQQLFGGMMPMIQCARQFMLSHLHISCHRLYIVCFH